MVILIVGTTLGITSSVDWNDDDDEHTLSKLHLNNTMEGSGVSFSSFSLSVSFLNLYMVWSDLWSRKFDVLLAHNIYIDGSICSMTLKRMARFRAQASSS